MKKGLDLKRLVILFFAFVFFINPLSAMKQETDADLKVELQETSEIPSVWWVGHNGWLIKAGSLLISTDLVLEEPERISPPPISAEELAPFLDISFITHWHGDHFHGGTSKILLEKSDCLFVMPKSCIKAARELGIPDSRIRIAVPREPFGLMGIQVQPIRAVHGNENFAVYEKANLDDCGYLLTMGGRRFLQPGDSVLLEDQLFLEDVDVLFFSPTVHNTHIDRSVILINTLEPDYILPQHRDTYRENPRNKFWTHGYPYEVKALLSRELQKRYHVLPLGRKLQIK